MRARHWKAPIDGQARKYPGARLGKKRTDQYQMRTALCCTAGGLLRMIADTAHAMLETLPLGQVHLMSFELIPLGPLAPFRRLAGMTTKP